MLIQLCPLGVSALDSDKCTPLRVDWCGGHKAAHQGEIVWRINGPAEVRVIFNI